MARCVRPGFLVSVLVLGLFLLPGPAMAQGLNARMQKVLFRFVETTGNSIMGVGSWISGKGFDPASSDFDMRLVMPQGGTEAQQLARWQQARSQLASMVKQEFGEEAGRILSRTNLYPPNQLMQGVENAADAVERFQKLNTAPNLAHSGPVTGTTSAKYTEGLYGSGSQTYVQGYERGTGRLFYNNNGKAVTGLSELAHLGEGTPKYTAAGTANTAGQWAQHAMEELTAGRGEKVAKYLERLERDLIKSRSLSNLPLDDAFRKQLQGMRDLLKSSPAKLGDVADDVARLLTRGRAEAAILGGFENAGAMRRAYLRVMLDGVAAKSKLGELLQGVLKKTPDWVNAQNVINFVVLAAGTHATSQALGRGDVMETIGATCSHLKWVTAFGPMLLAEVTSEILREAENSGYALAAGSQEAWDLMAGIYSSWGRADVDPDPRRKLTLADMVANFQYEHKLEAIVYAQALRASTRDLGEATAQADKGVADAIFAKCWPPIRDAWRWERDMLTSEYLQLGSEVVLTPILIYYTPKEPKVGQLVTCEARSVDGKLGERLERMNQIIRVLYGRGSLVSTTYYWTPDGTTIDDRDWKRGFRFDKPGKHSVKVQLAVQPHTSHTQTEPRVMLRREVPAMVDVEVSKGDGNEPEICSWCGQPLGTGENCMNCALHRFNPEE